MHSRAERFVIVLLVTATLLFLVAVAMRIQAHNRMYTTSFQTWVSQQMDFSHRCLSFGIEHSEDLPAFISSAPDCFRLLRRP